MAGLMRHMPVRENQLTAAESREQQVPIRAACGVEWIPKYIGDEVPRGTPLCRDCSRWMNGYHKPHYVYRYYDTDGALLYVGCTRIPVERHNQHRRSAAWFNEVVTVRRTVFPDRGYALAVEKLAIQTESPRHNRTLRAAS